MLGRIFITKGIDMYLYKEKVKKEFNEIRKNAFNVYMSFCREESTGELLKKVELLENRYNNIVKILPIGIKDKSDFSRHIYWLKYWLEHKQPLECIQDIIDICERDIDDFEEQFDRWCLQNINIDKDISKVINHLLEEFEPNAAVVQSFKLLTTRLRRNYKIKNKDGCSLIELIYSQTGKAKGKISDSTREGLNHLLRGMYILFRNEHAHDKIKTKPYESEAIISMINYLLLRLKYKKI